MTLRGSCLCGAVRYEIAGSLTHAGHCHCSICRKAHGAAFATWAGVEAGHFRWTQGAHQVRCRESSPGHVRCFCEGCGAPLAAMHGGEVTEVVFASLDDPGIRPEAHIFVGSHAIWHEITDGLPQFDRWPPGFGN